MEKHKLCKRRRSGRNTDGQATVYAYEGGVWDYFTDLADSLRSGGVVATDTARVGPVTGHYTVRSPVSVTQDSTGTTVSLEGPFPVEVGVSVAPVHSGASGSDIFGEDQIEGMKRVMMVGM